MSVSWQEFYNQNIDEMIVSEKNDEEKFNDILNQNNLYDKNQCHFQEENQPEISEKTFKELYLVEKKSNLYENINKQEDGNNKNISIVEEKFEIIDLKSNFNNFNVFSIPNYDTLSNNLINEAINDINKGPKKIIKKKIFTQTRKQKKKKILKRKDNSDNIRKKIKARFHKALKNVINEKLKNAGSIYFFKPLPQSFITSLRKEKNKEILNLSLKEIFLKEFNDKEKGKKSNFNKYKHNKFVLHYLEKNNDICQKSNFNKIKNMKYYEIYNEYLESKEFELEISTLKKENENDNYIKKYIIKARNLILYFS